MICVSELTKTYGRTVAVDNISRLAVYQKEGKNHVNDLDSERNNVSCAQCPVCRAPVDVCFAHPAHPFHQLS